MLPAVLTGVFLFASTTARTSDALLGWNCGYTFTSNVVYSVLCAVSPEVFPTKDRGTGDALVSSVNRIFGVMASSLMFYVSRCDDVHRHLSSRFTQTSRRRCPYMSLAGCS